MLWRSFRGRPENVLGASQINLPGTSIERQVRTFPGRYFTTSWGRQIGTSQDGQIGYLGDVLETPLEGHVPKTFWEPIFTGWVSFPSFDVHTLPIFIKLNVIKSPNLISFCNCSFTYKQFLVKYSCVFSNVFILTSNIHEQNTRSASHCLLTKSSCFTSKYVINTVAASAIKSWNFFQRKFSNHNLYQLSYSQLKVLIKNYLQSGLWLKTSDFFILTDFKLTTKLFLA